MSIGMRVGLLPVSCLIGLMITQPSDAGNLDRCDLARISAHNTIMDSYSQVISELARMTPAVKDMTALEAALNSREAADMGQADKMIAGECRGNTDELEGAVRSAVALARRKLSAVLSKYLTGIDLSRLLPQS